MRKDHPHTGSVHKASDRIDRVINRFSDGPKFMQQHSDRTEARHERINNARPDVQEWKGRLPLHMIEKLVDLDDQ